MGKINESRRGDCAREYRICNFILQNKYEGAVEFYFRFTNLFKEKYLKIFTNRKLDGRKKQKDGGEDF